MTKSKIPFKKAVLWIFLSLLVISGGSVSAYFYYAYVKDLREHDERYTIVAIVQSGPDKGVLKTEYLAELLNLSVDKPQNLFTFNLDKAEQQLLKSPLIKRVRLKRVKPGTLYINYKVRRPIAFIGNFSNTAIDNMGVFIPFKPFFSPKKIPTLILSDAQSAQWGSRLSKKKSTQILTLLNEIHSLSTTSQVEIIDISEAHLPSYGQRQIVIQLSNQIAPKTRFLRLGQKNIPMQLANYQVLENQIPEHARQKDTVIIDLRIPKLGFIGYK